MDAAIGLLAEAGFAAFTLQSVAARAEVLYGTVTHHYGTRDRLVEAMLEALKERYRERFQAFAESLSAVEGRPVPVLVEWLLDDAVDPLTAGAFLELWALATHDAGIAEGIHALYDDAIDACVQALRVDPATPGGAAFRQSLYLLGTVVEGSSALFGSRDTKSAAYEGFRRDARAMLVPFLEARLDAARAG
jgi:AcrR family transcriptional regulator